MNDSDGPVGAGRAGMTDADERTIRLFAYGTLQQRDVQLATYGRALDGTPDALRSYRLEPVTIADPKVVRLSGQAVHRIARPTGAPADRIPGVVFLLSETELAATDAYEGELYARVAVTLESGTEAFVYVAPNR